MADTYRVGAAEQLGALARVLDLPMCVVRDGDELARAITELADRDALLIDTAGLGAGSGCGREIEALLSCVPGPVSVAMVISASASRRSLERAWPQLSRLAPESCVVSKIDESGGAGDVLSWVADVGVPVRWLGTGTRVPDDLAPASGESLAHWLLAA
jgi:flagellar biosynthesis protein FlhF